MEGKLFEPGRMLAPPGALALAEDGVDLVNYLIRHLSGDWGELNRGDRAENDFSLKNGL